MNNFINNLTFENLFTGRALFYFIIFVIYELVYKIVVVNKLEERVKREGFRNQKETEEEIKNLYNEKIERLKAEYAGENAKLKHALDKLFSLQIQHRTEERQALMNFLASCNQWIFNLSTIKCNHYTLNNRNELRTKIETLQDEYFLQIHSERIKILLFIVNNRVNESTDHLSDLLRHYKLNMEKFLNDLLNLLDEQYKSGFEVTDIDEEGEYRYTRYGVDNSEKIKQLSSEFTAFNDYSFDSCMAQIEHFATVAKSYLTSLEFNGD